MLKFAAPFKMDAFRQLHLLAHHSLCFVHESPNVSAADVERHVIQEAAVFALNHGRPFYDPDLSYGA